MAGAEDALQPRSARFDPERPFLFEGLAPRFATRRVRSVFIPMRDGVRLSTDFHIPLGADLPLPVVLVRTPYNKNNAPTAMPALLPEQGIVYAIQDVRGRHESEGEFVACSGIDRLDGLDTVEWIASQTWCNGRVGTLGSSYTGETAAKIAAMRHPAHRCGVIMFDGSYGGGQTRNGAYLQGGVSLLRMMFGWYRDFVPKVSFAPPAGIDREAWYQARWADAYETQPVRQPPVDYDSHLKTLPVDTLLDRSGAAPSEFAAQMRASAEPCSQYFADQGFLTEADRFAAPHLFVTGPLERGGSSFDNFRLFQANADSAEVARHQYLWFTPAAHSGYAECEADTRFGARHFGDTRHPYYRDLVGWFTHWLLDHGAEIEAWPRVRYFLAGRNVWQEAQSWPPHGVVARRLYLAGEGALVWDKPVAEASVEYLYDPDDPTPSEPPETPVDLLGGGYADRSAIEVRDDVISFTMPPLEASLALAGAIELELYVSSSAPDTDFVAVLSEVDSKGCSINVTHGVARMRYRTGLDCPEMMKPGEIYRVTIDLWHAAIEVPAGNALRLSLSSSYFPVFDRNLNTGGDNFTGTEWRTARNAVHLGGACASALILPACAA
ncbi:CocE/NonD family hydrolase [Novosphingobium sp. Gsoil 351]|uniref:CocE/NonD family hydrolase n=1 Tax=Novosphingobium sp. Gsoil 351 TaxID=2675225 RepID=UPI0018A819D9|nr:CocE/NonD family hydrolase [Novosphingobium sp. Gsoil 351]